MCDNRERNYDWIRDRNGKPQLTRRGSYVMQNEDQVYFGFTKNTLPLVRALLDEIEVLDK